MLSILIPVFNYDVQELVSSLHEQAKLLKLTFEIRVYDDCSTNTQLENQNSSIENLDKVVYKTLSENLGFCKIRNLLAEEARYDNLLFLDSDVAIIKDDFLQYYLNLADPRKVYCGGMTYQSATPEKSKSLKWKHGKKREEATPLDRNEAAHRSIWAGNFFIHKKIYLATQFDENSTQYGYNDTMFGYKLLVNNVPVIHVDNPALHKGLMSTDKFINRSMEAVENLLFFEKQNYIEPSFYQFIKVFKYYGLLKKFGLDTFYLAYFQKNKEKWIKNLKSEKPKLRNLDMLKLGRLVQLKK